MLNVLGERLRTHVDAIAADRVSDFRLWLTVFLPVAAVYLGSAHWTVNSTDSVAAAWPAWMLVHNGTLRLDHANHLQFSPWFQHVHGHIVSNRMPGVVLIGVPVAAILAWTQWTPMSLSVITAALVTSAAIANTTLLLRRLGSARVAVLGAAVLAFGSAMWTVAGAELWAHGPDALWLTSGLLAAAQSRRLLAGALLAPAVLTRPQLGAVVLVLGAGFAWSRRDWKWLPSIGVPAAAALAAIEVYNRALFGNATVAPGSYSYASRNVLNGGGANLLHQAQQLLWTMSGSLVSPLHGLLVYTPAVLLALPAARSVWRSTPDWVRVAAVAGLAYLILQSRVNDFHGGYNYYGNRLTLESLILWTPFAFCGAIRLWSRGHRHLVRLLCAWSVGVGLVGAAFGRVVTLLVTADPWTTWTPADVLTKAGVKVVPVAAMVALLGLLLLLRRRQPTTSVAGTSNWEPSSVIVGSSQSSSDLNRA